MERYAPYLYYIISPQPKTIRVKCPDITKTGITPTLTGNNYNKPPWLNLLTLSQHQPPWTLSIGTYKAQRPHPNNNNTTYITHTKMKPTNNHNNWAHSTDTNNNTYADTILIIYGNASICIHADTDNVIRANTILRNWVDTNASKCHTRTAPAQSRTPSSVQARTSPTVLTQTSHAQTRTTSRVQTRTPSIHTTSSSQT